MDEMEPTGVGRTIPNPPIIAETRKNRGWGIIRSDSRWRDLPAPHFLESQIFQRVDVNAFHL